jgi:hypothetical protein
MLPIEPSSARLSLRVIGPISAARWVVRRGKISVLVHLTSRVGGRQDHVRDLLTPRSPEVYVSCSSSTR